VRVVPQAKGGRRAHPPEKKDYSKKMNRKEEDIALRSSIAATRDKELARYRGHRVDGISDLPIVVEDRLQEVKKTKDALASLFSLGLLEELERANKGKEDPSRQGQDEGEKVQDAQIGPDSSQRREGNREGMREHPRSRRPGRELSDRRGLRARDARGAPDSLDRVCGKEHRGGDKMEALKVLRYPLMGEKATLLRESNNMLTFIVDPNATKREVKEAVEQQYGTKVVSVSIVNTTNGKKKAYLKLAADQSAEEIASHFGVV
jgi:ribosomal protein L23